MSSCIDLSKGKFKVIFVVQDINKVCIEWMDILEFMNISVFSNKYQDDKYSESIYNAILGIYRNRHCYKWIKFI